jgi:hypothetical protein
MIRTKEIKTKNERQKGVFLSFISRKNCSTFQPFSLSCIDVLPPAHYSNCFRFTFHYSNANKIVKGRSYLHGCTSLSNTNLLCEVCCAAGWMNMAHPASWDIKRKR